MLKRLGFTLLRLLVVIDILLQVLVKLPVYVITGRYKPSAYMTISATVGMLSEEGNLFGIYSEKFIDTIFGDGHCSSSWLFYKNLNSGND